MPLGRVVPTDISRRAQGAASARMIPPLSPRNRRVLDALDGTFRTPLAIAIRAGLPTRDRTEHAAAACKRLVYLGLAERLPSKRQWRGAGSEKA
jgi:hypothetical protein